ncbi:hypothetical protein GCM10023185_18370 [Hymenobacter saemangeumensis]|uniref:Secretion system C-terminal sorting domain-containing protein n=1 Tax=Hymenobacter saemangeumensis TaxID=1084522 RepID=A0ABP8IBK1_9BACT
MNLPYFRITACFLGLSFTSLEQAQSQNAGTLDPAFGNAGKVFTSFDLTGASIANAAVLQSDGKIIVGGSGSAGLTLARYNPNGSLDSSFGTGGLVYAGMGSSPPSNVYPNGNSDPAFIVSIVVQPSDGKILVAGKRGFEFMVARYHPNGTLDLSFGTNGLYTDVSAHSSNINRKILPTNYGRLLLVGEAIGLTNHYISVRCLHPNGTLDTSYGQNGFAFVSLQTPCDALLDQAGNLVIAGQFPSASNTSHHAVTRLLPSGLLDTSFGQNGRVVEYLTPYSFVRGLVMQADGKLVLVGRGHTSGGWLWRLLPNGALDFSFGYLGSSIISFGNSTGALNSVLVQPDGKLVAVGLTQSPGAFFIARTLADGSPDPGFGTNGQTVFAETGAEGLNHVLLQPDSKLVAVGYSYAQANSTGPARYAVFRFLNQLASGLPVQALNSLPDVFPNPAAGMLTVRLAPSIKANQPIKLTLTNLLGQQIVSTEGKTSPAQQDVSVDVSSVSTGVYLLRGTTGSISFSRKITITR